MKKTGFFFAVGTFISAILIIFCIESILSAYQHNENIENITSANNALAKLRRESNEIFALQKEINQFYGIISESNISQNNSELTILCTDFFNKGYNFVNLRFFDKSKNKISVKRNQENDKLNGAMQRLYQALATSKLNGDNSLLKKYRSLFEVLLGAVDLDYLAEQPSTLIPVTLNGKPAYFYWNVYEVSENDNNLSGMIAWIKQSEIPNRFFCQKIVEQYNNDSFVSGSNRVFGFLNTNEKGFIYPENLTGTDSNVSYSELTLKIQELKASLKSHDSISNRLLNYIDLGNGKYFFCLSQEASSTSGRLTAIIFEILLLIVTTCVCCFAINYLSSLQLNSAKDSVSQIAIKYYFQTNLLFIFILAIFLYSTNSFIEKLSIKNKKDMIYTNIYSVMDWLNEGYYLAQKDLTNQWIALSKEKSLIDLNKISIDNICKNLYQKNKLSKMFITDKEGKIIYSYPNSNNNNVFSKFIPVIARKICNERLTSEENWKNKIDSLMIDSVSKNFADLLGENANTVLKAFETYDSATEFEFGNKKHIVFSTIIAPESKNPKVLIIWLDSDKFSLDYYVNRIKDSEMLPANLKQTSLAIVPIQMDKLPYPREITKYSFARDITERVAFTKRPTQFETTSGGQNLLGVGALLNSIPNYVVFALQSSE